jgi:hypothetical protein
MGRKSGLSLETQHYSTITTSYIWFFPPYLIRHAASRNLTEAQIGAIVALRKLYDTEFA